MCEKRQLEEFEQKELEEILEAPISLTGEATALTKKFNELLDQTTHVSPEVLNIRLMSWDKVVKHKEERQKNA